MESTHAYAEFHHQRFILNVIAINFKWLQKVFFSLFEKKILFHDMFVWRTIAAERFRRTICSRFVGISDLYTLQIGRTMRALGARFGQMHLHIQSGCM